MGRILLACATGIVLSGAAAGAHHSISGAYDSSRRLTIDGVVAQFQFVNPHPFVALDVLDPSGSAQRWKLEMDNRHELVDIGVTASTLRPGDRLVVTGSPARSQPQSLYVLRLDRPADGFAYEQVGNSPRIRTPAR
ncbi:MAG: DUF6152 family protein [Acidobacteriota bacterium]